MRRRPARSQLPPKEWERSDHARPFEAWQAGYDCRVCSAPIKIGDAALKRSWCTEYAHAGCGWLRPDERAPHEVHGAELRTRLFEWACPRCSRDVVRSSMPEAGADLRCRACRESVPA